MYGDSGTAYLVASPMFHLSGLANSLAPLWAGSTMVIPPSDMPPSPSILVEMMKHVEIHTLALPPSVWEDLVGEHPTEFLEVAKHLKYVIYGGGGWIFWFNPLAAAHSVDQCIDWHWATIARVKD